MDGGDGDDTLDGGTGNDVLVGGAGFDEFHVDSLRDVVVDEADAPGHVISTVNWRLVEDLANLTLVGPLARVGWGSSIGNEITGNAAANVLYGLNGADTLDGGGAADNLRGGNQNDSLIGAEGNDTLQGDAGADSLEGGENGDLLNGGAGNDLLIGGGGADALVGGGGADRFVLEFTTDPLQSDRIAEFSRVAGDRLEILGTGLLPGALDPTAFLANASGLATAATHRLVYENDAGRLWFDADGNAAASTRVLVANLTGTPALTAADILIG
jgi:Ca2+-binding RTX toxin-like protein